MVLAVFVTGAIVAAFPPPSAHATSPGTVATTSTNRGIGFGYQQYACGANGLYWVFYDDGSAWGYRTSPDGASWSSETTLTGMTGVATGDSSDMAFYCSGTTIYYAGTDESGDGKFFYRSGTLESSGQISWSAAEAAVPTSNPTDTFTSVAVDSAGNVWVAVTTTSTEPGSQVEVYENPAGTTTWTGYTPYTSPYTAAGELVPLSSGIALLFATSFIGSQITEYLFNGAWSAGASTTGSNYEMDESSAVAIGATLELCTTDGTDVDYMSIPSGGSWSSPTTLSSGTGCSLTGNGGTTLGAFYITGGSDAVDFVQSNTGAAATFGSPSVLSASDPGITFINTASVISTDPASQAIAVWLTDSGASYSIMDATVNTVPLLEQVTIDQANSGPSGTATVSGCDAAVASIPMNGVPQTFAANPSCSLTISVPPDQPFSVYRFPGQASTWTFTTGASGTQVETKPVYLEYAITASYSVTGGAEAPSAPLLTTSEDGTAYTPALMTTPTVYWINNGATWSVPATLTLLSQTWTTSATTSGTISSPTTLAFAYAPPVPPVTTTTAVTLPPVVTTTTVTSYASTFTSTITSTATTTTTTSVTQLVPTGAELSCDQFRLHVGQTSNCNVWITTADAGTPTGKVSWKATSGQLTDERCNFPNDNNYPDQGQLVCQAQYTPSAAGAQTITASYSGDAYHSGASDTDQVFVGSLSGNPATSTKLTCFDVTVTSGESTGCTATVVTADGNPAAGSTAWSAIGGTLSQESCGPQFQGVLVCQAKLTAGSAGVVVITVAYGSDPKHSSSSDSVQIFVSPSYNYTTSIVSAAAIVGIGGSVVVLRRRSSTGAPKNAP